MLVTATTSFETLNHLYHHLYHRESSDVPNSIHHRRPLLAKIQHWLENTLLGDNLEEVSEMDDITRQYLDQLCAELEAQLERICPHGEWLAIVPVDVKGTILVLLALDG